MTAIKSKSAEKVGAVEELTAAEVIELAAVDSEFFCREFFPRTVRQDLADFHHDAWQRMESEARLVNLLMFRGAGKTSHCRLYTAKSISYGLSNTILYIGKSEGHAIRSTSWIKKQIEHNAKWNKTYGISAGSKWQDTEFEVILHEGTAHRRS